MKDFLPYANSMDRFDTMFFSYISGNKFEAFKVDYDSVGHSKFG